MKKVVIVTGGFDPIHSGHIEYFNHAKQLGDLLVVGVNSDEWLVRKKGKPFMNWNERANIVNNLHMTDAVIAFDDADNTAINAIQKVKEQYPECEIIFANGGDRNKDNIPEMVFEDVEFVFGVGGNDKSNSSSEILAKWHGEIVARPWGWYRVIDQGKGYKVKELEILPGKRLSMQRHKHRAERWNVVQGTCTIITDYKREVQSRDLSAHDMPYTVNKMVWHQACNNTTTSCKIIEVQIGDICEESDIERKVT
jgi:cytidyltransferase-like protein